MVNKEAQTETTMTLLVNIKPEMLNKSEKLFS